MIKKHDKGMQFALRTLFMLLFLLGVRRMPVLADAGDSRVLRVAFPEVKGLSETDADGTRHGVVVDYLNEIAKYTNWEYEYVDVEGDDVLDELEKDGYDLIGGTYYVEGGEQYYGYPDYNIGYSKAMLVARRDDKSVQSYDLESISGKTIGVYENASENIRRLNEFLSINNLHCTLKYYSREELMGKAELYPYLENGDVDLVLGNNVDDTSKFRVVASYDSQPYYIVTNVGNQEVLDGLNMALEKILDADPSFAADCYNANFTDQDLTNILLNDEEIAYIRQKKVVTVAVPRRWHPLFCMNDADELHRGLIPDMLEQITAFTGLQFFYVYADSYGEAVSLVQKKEADLLGFFIGTETEAADTGLALSSAYVSMNSIVVRNKKVSYPSEGLVCAVIKGQNLPDEIIASKVKVYSDVPKALAAVSRGEADFIYGLANRLEQDIQRFHFSNLVPVTLVNDRSELCFALQRPVESELLTILNKSINSLSPKEKSAILSRNIVSIGTANPSVIELIYSYPILFVFILSVILLAFVISVLMINRARVKSAVMQSNLERLEAASKAKSEFLSRMSHEIRTPMNAIVGLTDLIGMERGLSEDALNHLSKLRSSAHYLLDLISDILDMSRIESGMMCVVSEPFSMKRTIDEVYATLDSEASRRGLHFKVELHIVHDGVNGDAIRLRQVLNNLISNAFKFTPGGGEVCLYVEETVSDAKKAEFCFRVMDNGVGISPENQKRIFEVFEQVGANSSRSQGTGLGLPISQNIVHMMGGELSVKSEPDQGSEFYFSVTFLLEEHADDTRTDWKITAEEKLLEHAHILLAEDNDLNAEIVTRLLLVQGAEVVRCCNGREVAEQFAKSRRGEFGMILMDIQMPEMNGLEATRVIRASNHPDAGTVPIVAMTANSFKEDVDAALEAGMNAHLSKPIEPKHMYHTLHGFLGGSSGI